MRLNLPPDEYYKQLAKVPSSSSAVIRNSKGEFLVVKRTYKDGFALVGGMNEEGELPTQGLKREIREEIGIDLSPLKAVCVDFLVSKPFNRVNYVFDCGSISEEQIAQIKIDPGEISDLQFLSASKILEVSSPNTRNRIKNYLGSLDGGNCVYLENSEDIAISLRQQSQ